MGGKRKRGEGGGSLSKPASTNKSQHGNKKVKVSTVPQKNVNVPVVANANWMALKSKIQPPTARKKRDLDVKAQKQRLKEEKQAQRMKAKTAEWVDNSRIIALDCEMVGVGLAGKTSVLARCSIVDYEGKIVYDQFVRPVEKVTDFRTHVSGIRSRTLRNAIPFAQCIKEVGKLLQDKIIVGHALKNDFQALMFTPPKHLIRDTAHYRPYMRRKRNGTKLYPKSLKNLAEDVLGKQIQTGQHDSVEDARATLELYKREQYAWEKYVRTNKSKSTLVGVAPALPVEKNPPNDDMATPLSTTAGPGDEDELRSGKRGMVIPDTHELAIMEYGE